MIRRSLLTLTITLLAAAGCGPEERSGPVAPPWDRKVILLAMDGLDWRVLDPLIESGEAPGFAKLRREGAWSRLSSHEPLFSPVVWTSVATGKTPEKHGIRSFTVETAAGPIPVTSNLRRARTLWDILGSRERTVGVVGWWATWPAEAVNGFLCSDRTWPLQMGEEGWPVTTSGPAAVAGMKRRTYPEELIDEISRLIVLRDDLDESAMQLIDVRGSLGTVGVDGPAVADMFAKDLSFDRIGQYLYQTRQPEFFSVYYEIVDVMAHYFWPHYEYYRHVAHGEPSYFTSPPGGIDAGMAESIGRNYEKSYLYADRAVQEAFEDAPPGTYIIVASDHGYGTYPEQPEIRVGDDVVRRVAHWHKPDGVLMIWGPGVAKGEIEADVYDVAPTVLWLMGLPVADDMDGEPLLDAFLRQVKKTTTLARIPTYETEASRDTVPVASPEDPAFLERLRSLGYVR